MEHFYQDIQGWFTAEDIYREAVERAPKDRLSRFVEVGCWKGKSAAFMAVEIVNSGKPINLYCIDSWEGSPTECEHMNDPDLSKLFYVFEGNVLDKFDNVFPIRYSSLQAVHVFMSMILDFVFIDASHEYKDVKADIMAWAPKLCNDGVLAGDDFSWPGVWRAVRECIGLENVQRRGGCWVRK